MNVPDSLQRCIRILVHWNTDKSQEEIHHVYIKDAVKLRPDLSDLPAADWEELDTWIRETMGESD